MKKLLAGIVAVALFATAGVAVAAESARSSANSAVSSGAGVTSFGPAASFAITGATNSSVGTAVASQSLFGPTSTVTGSNSTGSTVQTGAQTGFSFGTIQSAQQGAARARARATSPF